MALPGCCTHRHSTIGLLCSPCALQERLECLLLRGSAALIRSNLNVPCTRASLHGCWGVEQFPIFCFSNEFNEWSRNTV